MTSDAQICVVDDDPDVRDSTRILLESAGYAVRDFEILCTQSSQRGSPARCTVKSRAACWVRSVDP